ncbi:amidohydrolase [Nocardia yamanashiensis]|uniref:amidohydrolase family protein n=1 Tax=Nocardia yamanashiensis TaxID=209247 RepID=UPI001E590E2D|nr:amidohydrolase family protein [Nocardia yamanashiensis]UGT44910.1 amidohydrolase [Nocardia yamanashiensis]
MSENVASGSAHPLSGAIDVHAHFLTPRLRQALVAAGHAQPDGMPALPEWSAAAALELMDRTGVEVALLSVSSPGVLMQDPRETRDLARTVNEEGARLVHDHPARFGLLASVPLPDVDAAVAEVAHAFDELSADGIALETNYGGTYLGDPAFAPLLAELDSRHAVVHLHPTSPACWQHTSLGRPRPMIEFLFDTTRTVAQLILDRVTERYPNIRFIVPHAGAALPVLADRIAGFAVLDSPASPVDVLAALGRMHYDVAGFALPRALPALMQLVTPDRLLYGSDFPFTPDWAVHGLAEALASTTLLTPSERRLMLRGNASALFPRLRPPHRPDPETAR